RRHWVVHIYVGKRRPSATGSGFRHEDDQLRRRCAMVRQETPRLWIRRQVLRRQSATRHRHTSRLPAHDAGGVVWGDIGEVNAELSSLQVPVSSRFSGLDWDWKLATDSNIPDPF